MNAKYLPITVITIVVIALASVLFRNEPLMKVPTADISIMQNLSSDTSQKESTRVIKEADLDATLQSSIEFTLFAPTDDAYASLDPEIAKMLKEKTNNIMQVHTANNHLVLGNYSTSSFNDGMILTTVNSEQIKITKKNNKWYINDAEIVKADVTSRNGVIHSINKVLLPHR